jgi:UDP-glucose 4-epimerase
MDYILVTGGFGFIGSHICVELLNANHNIIVIDNLSNSKIDVYNKIVSITNKEFKYFIFDLLDKSLVYDVFKKYNIKSIIHLAGLKAVNESIKNPLKYYRTNIDTTLNLLELINDFNIEKFIFSSSATVYGLPSEIPLKETSQVGLNITNPYGQTKYMLEKIIMDFSKTSSCKFIILRYFNPVGAHPSGLIGEDPNDIPNNLMPYLLKVANGTYPELKIFGNDYESEDGTCVRDFIHVVDLAKAHLKSIEYLNKDNLEIFNIGTGKGTSVLELVNTFINVNNIKLKYSFGPKREGDIPKMYCDASKAKYVLKWEPTKTIENICFDSFNFINK